MLRLPPSSFRRCERGVAMLEFALALPLLLLFLFGCIEMSRYIMVHQKIDKTTNTLDDLATQSLNLTDELMTNMSSKETVSNLMRPYKWDPGADKITFTVIQRQPVKDANGAPTGQFQNVITMRFPEGGDTRVPGATKAVISDNPLPQDPAFTLVPNERVVVTETFYRFHPLMGDNSPILRLFSTGNKPFIASDPVYKIAVMRPRLAQALENECPTDCIPIGQSIPPAKAGCFQQTQCAPPTCEKRCPNPNSNIEPPNCDLSKCTECPTCVNGGTGTCVVNSDFPQGVQMLNCPPNSTCTTIPRCCNNVCYRTEAERQNLINNGCTSPRQCVDCSKNSIAAGCLLPGERPGVDPDGNACPTSQCCDDCYMSPPDSSDPLRAHQGPGFDCKTVRQCGCAACPSGTGTGFHDPDPPWACNFSQCSGPVHL